MRISTRGRYALRLMIDLADNSGDGAPVALADLADRQQLSKRYLEQLATSLRNASLVAATPGRCGGYLLRRSPEEISAAEILAASIGPIDVVPCVCAPQLCPRAGGCPSRGMWVRINESVTEILQSVSLADLREEALERPPRGRLVTPCTSPGGER